jgi:hypothetical protein
MVTIDFPSGWTNAAKLERILAANPGPHTCSEVTFRFQADSKLMIDAAVRLLSLLNQLDYCTRRVIVIFDDGLDGVMGYLNRVGFFDNLAPSIEVLPERPYYSGAALYGGGNAGLVEIERINRQHIDPELPTRLVKAVCGEFLFFSIFDVHGPGLGEHDSKIQRRSEVPGPHESSVNQYGVGHPRTTGIPLINLVVD